LPEFLRKAKPSSFVIEYHHDPKNKFRFKQDTPDDEWIAAVAQEGWIIFSHDRQFHARLPEIAAIKQHSGGCFYLPGANSPTWDKLYYFVRGYRGIEWRVRETPRPFIFNLSREGRFKRVKIP
jgi:PIN domain-containing protein